MRLRLSVQRHALPQVDLVWAVPDDAAHATTTVSQLLTEINDIVPLESESWGLEDYVVQLGSFELLHFSRLSQILKDEDHVTIRPIQTVEVRQRTLTGRLQIDSGGRHLIDGVPFGRQLLRRPVRPVVHIPSPDISTALSKAIPEDQLAIAPRGPSDMDVTPHNLARNGDVDVDEEGDGNYEPPSRLRKYQRRNSNTPDRSERSVHFEDGGVPGNDQALIVFPSDDDNTEDEFNADEDNDASSGSESGTDKTNGPSGSSEGSSSSEEEESSGSDSSNDSDAEMQDQDNQDSGSDSDDSDSETSSSEDTSSDSEPEQLSSKATRSVSDTTTGVQNPNSNDGRGSGTEANKTLRRRGGCGPPFEGKRSTQERNKRRRVSKRIRRLISRGELTGQVGVQELREWEAVHGVPHYQLKRPPRKSNIKESSEIPSRTLSNGMPAASNEKLDLGLSNGLTVASNPEETLEQMRQRLLTRLSVVMTPESNDGLKEVEQPPSVEVHAAFLDGTEEAAETSTTPEVNTAEETTSEPHSEQPAPKRARLDVGGARRMLFGSLGVRNPKTKEEEEKLQKRLAAKQAKKVVPAAQPEETEQEDESPTDPELWKKKVKLMAFECCDEGVELSTPPFPFQQRWDPQQQLQPKGRKGKKGKKRKRQQVDYYDEEYDEGEGEYGDDGYYEDGYYADAAEEEWEGLDYDDPVDAATVDAAESQLLQDADAITAPRSESPDLPPVPEDHSTLPIVGLDTLNRGDVITFKRFEMSAETGWQPGISDVRTARVEEPVDEGAIYLRLAKRDRPRRKIQFNKRGQRLYDRFEMAGVTEDEENGFLELEMDDVLEPRLLQAAAQSADGGDGVGDGDIESEGVVEQPDEHTGEGGAATIEIESS